MNKIDYEGIISNLGINIYKSENIEAIKQALRQALPIILEHVADKAYKTSYLKDRQMPVDKGSITSQKEELSKILGI